MNHKIKNSKRNNKAAIELSIGTIVIIVLAMSMLILGLVLVRSIFTGAKYNVDQLNKNVEAEINKLFNDDAQKIAVYLPNRAATVKKGNTLGVALGVRNTEQLTNDESTFGLSVFADSSGIERGCAITVDQANKLISYYEGGISYKIPSGDIHYNAVHFRIPETNPLCELSYSVEVKKNGQIYSTDFFTIKITG